MNHRLSFIYLLGVWFVFSCIPPEHSFDQFVQDFTWIQGEEFRVDSITWENLRENNPYPIIETPDWKFVQSLTFAAKCGELPEYHFYRVGKLQHEREIYLIYFLELNARCQYDGTEQLFVLAKYRSGGHLNSEKIIGRNYAVFGYSELSSFKIIPGSGKLELTHRFWEIKGQEEILKDTTEYTFLWK